MAARTTSPIGALGIAMAIAGCAANANMKAGTEFDAQDDARPAPAPAPVASSTPAPAETSTPAQPAPAPVASSDPAPACPIRCAIVTPNHRALDAAEEERLRAAFTPALGALRACTTREQGPGRWHAPSLTLRFATSGELLDVGVDSSGWDQAADACMQSVGRGSADVKLEGPATVRCAEHCERPRPVTKKPAKKK